MNTLEERLQELNIRIALLQNERSRLFEERALRESAGLSEASIRIAITTLTKTIDSMDCERIRIMRSINNG